MQNEGCSNLPPWKHASAVYSRAYALLRDLGADGDLIDALGDGDEERIKASMLRLNAMALRKQLSTRRGNTHWSKL